MYAITGWNENYETSDSRKTSGPMDWYKARTRMNGIKFAMIMREKDGAALFGCWHVFLSIAASQKKDERGKLTSGGKELTATDIELMTRIGHSTIQRALDFLSSQDIGWIEVVRSPEISGDLKKSPEVSGSFPTRLDQNRIDESRAVEDASHPRTRFVKPTVDQVRSYSLEIGNAIDAEKFMNHYESNGWKVGRNPMKDWKATVRKWASGSSSFTGQHKPEPQNVIRLNLNAPMPKTAMELMLESEESTK